MFGAVLRCVAVAIQAGTEGCIRVAADRARHEYLIAPDDRAGVRESGNQIGCSERSCDASPSPYRPGRKVAFGSLLTALVTNILSPQTTGLECASPGIGVRHRMFSPVLTSHLSGRFCFSTTPEACVPRNEGQLPFAPFGSGRVDEADAIFPAVLTMCRADMVFTSLAGAHV